jgi:HD superfamily phosphohydrolase
VKIIKDPVHGYVEVDGATLRLLDAIPLQRLRYIRQLGFSHLVYPGANHTRFEHSLGTMHLARMMCGQLELSAEMTKTITAAALLHDIGHGPFSHATEDLMREYLGRSHHEIADLIASSGLEAILEELGIGVGEVCGIVDGTHPFAGIIHGDLDVDRMDYLMRDAHYTGVPYGTVDAHRLIRRTILTEKGIALSESGINAAESLLIARTLMRPAVYFHHVSRIAESMVKLAAVEHLEHAGPEELQRLLSMTDAGLISTLLGSESTTAHSIASRLLERRLYKRVLYAGRDMVNAPAVQGMAGIVEERRAAAEIAAAAGVDETAVLVDIPPFPSDMSMDVMVRNRHDLVDLEQLSPLLSALNETRRIQWRVGVYVLPEHREEVTVAAAEVLRVRRPTKQDKLTEY